MLKVAICDDEQKDIDIAEKCILEYSFKHNLDIECANYRTGQELLDKMESGEHYDFFVFDVQMEKEDGSDEEQELIQEASDADIPVVTVLTDDSSSARISFVGLNSYQLGNAYTEQILGLLKEHENTQVLLLSNSQSKTQETNLIYYQIKKELEEKKKDYQTVTISEYNIDSSSGFDTEEFVRDIFVSEENLPDVLVCMDEVVTECVYQALVDYNQVGNVDVVGFYYSDVILDGISKGIISSAIALDMDEIGRYSVNALEEFSSLGHTSNYYSVGQHVITRSNVGAYRTEGN